MVRGRRPRERPVALTGAAATNRARMPMDGIPGKLCRLVVVVLLVLMGRAGATEPPGATAPTPASAAPTAAEDASRRAEDIDPDQALLVIADQERRGVLITAAAQAERAHWEARRRPGRSLIQQVWVLAGILLTISTVVLLRRHLWPLLRSVSPVVYECLAWAACAGVIAGGWWAGPPDGALIALPGLLGISGAIGLSARLHLGEATLRRPGRWGHLLSLPPAVAWVAAGIAFDSGMLGYLAAAGLLTWLGFAIGAMPGAIMVGFRDRGVVPIATIGALVIGALGTLRHVDAIAAQRWAVLLPGFLVLGTAVFLLGLLILSSTWYSRSAGRWWWPFQVLVLGLHLGVSALGSWLGDGALLGLGATFTALLVIEKFCELTWRRGIWLVFGLALLLYLLAMVISWRPGWFFQAPPPPAVAPAR